MTPQELKNSILQLAIQGKLVEQRPDEGTAEELYQQIQIKMPNLMQLRNIKDEETPFEIPDNWFWVRLGTSLIIERGGSPRPIKSFLTDSDNGINWIKISDATASDRYIFKTKEKISKAIASILKGKFPQTKSNNAQP